MSHNTWIHKIVRVGVRPLAKTRVTPNHLTALRLFTGLAAAGLMAMGRWPEAPIGAGVFLISMFLDRADGELARMTGKMSPGGHRFDLFADAFANSIAFVALGIGLREGNILGYWAIPMGAVAGISIALNFWLVVAVEELKGSRAAEIKGKWGFDADDAVFVIPIAVWAGQDVPIVVAAFVFAPLFTVWASMHLTERHGLGQSPFRELIRWRARATPAAVLRPVETSPTSPRQPR